MKKDKLLKASELFHKMGDIYKELHDTYDAEDTQENVEKVELLTGKIFFTLQEIQSLDV